MKLLCKIILFALISTSVSYAQNESFDLLEEANELHKEKKYKEALRVYNDIVFNYQKSEMYPYAIFGKAETLIALNEMDYAIHCYKEFLHKYYNNRNIFTTLFGRGYNSAFESAMKIADYNYERGNYQEALYYYVFADTAHLYTTTCGSDYFFLNQEMALLQAKCLEKLDRNEEAMDICLKYIFPGLFSHDSGLFSEEGDRINLAITVTDKNYSNSEVVAELNNALNNIYSVPYKYDSTQIRYYLKLFGREIIILDKGKKKPFIIESTERAKELSRDVYFFQHYLTEK